MRSITERLRRLEEIKPAGIVLEIDGQRMTAREFAVRGHDFFQARIVSGNSLKDAELLLSLFPSVIE